MITSITNLKLVAIHDLGFTSAKSNLKRGNKKKRENPAKKCWLTIWQKMGVGKDRKKSFGIVFLHQLHSHSRWWWNDKKQLEKNQRFWKFLQIFWKKWKCFKITSLYLNQKANQHQYLKSKTRMVTVTLPKRIQNLFTSQLV